MEEYTFLIYIKSVNPNDCLTHPHGICVQVKENGDEVIFVSEIKAQKVFLFDSSLKLIKTIGNDLNDVKYISIDSKNLYVSHYWIDIVSIFNYNDGKLITKLKIERPIHSTSDLNKLYIVSYFIGREGDHIKVDIIKKGNYVNVISKLNFNIINKFQFDNWCCTRSIYLSNDGNIYTTAHELYNNIKL